ncbi:MAG: CPBP family intramembrane metalloprotease, partial [Methylococcales bacterium]|nr:CPBP family intramembrane metalloprotease [Methylococcales bacterium]
MTEVELLSVTSLMGAIASVWLRPGYLCLVFFAVFLASALYSGWIAPVGIMPIAVLSCLFFGLHRRQSPWTKRVLWMLVMTGCFVFGVHLAPGFESIVVLENTALSDRTGWSGLRFSADKPIVGFLLLLFYRSQLIRSAVELKRAIGKAVPVILIVCLVVYAIGLTVGYVSIDWSPSYLIWIWFFRNLLFTVVAEELLFRGVIQRGIARRLNSAYGDWYALLIVSVLFGAVHLHGGWEYGL